MLSIEKNQKSKKSLKLSKEIDKQVSSITYENVKDTPFTIASVKDKGHFILMGNNRLTNAFDTKEEAIQEARSITWNKIVQVCMVLLNDKKIEK